MFPKQSPDKINEKLGKCVMISGLCHENVMKMSLHKPHFDCDISMLV